jgi:hypothetical protein
MELPYRQRLDRPDKAGRANIFGDLHWAGLLRVVLLLICHLLLQFGLPSHLHSHNKAHATLLP